MPLICPTCQNVFAGSLKASRPATPATLHGVVFDILVGSENRVGLAAGGNELAADFIVDALSRGTLTLELLDRVGLPRPEERQIGIDLHYATAMFRIPSSVPPDWRAVLRLN